MRKAKEEGLRGLDAWTRVAQLMKQHSDNPMVSPIGKDIH